MAKRYEAAIVIDRPIEGVFAFLADGTNDPKFSPRVQEITKKTDGPVGGGTIYVSTVKDAGMTTKREFEITRFDAPTTLRWKELSKNLVTVPDGGYELSPSGTGTNLTISNEFEGHGFGKLIAPLALRGAKSDADAFATRIKQAVEAAI